MKRTAVLFLMLVTFLGACATAPGGEASGVSSRTAEASSVGASSVGASSAPAGEEEDTSVPASGSEQTSPAASLASPASEPLPGSASATSSPSPIHWYDVRAAIQSEGLSPSGDVSICFPSDAEGFLINGGTYKVDADTLRRIVRTPCTGDGAVVWKDFSVLHSTNNDDLFTGVIPASKLNDPIYVSMNLPSEAQTFMTWRVNPENMTLYDPKYKQFQLIGAIYRNADATLKDSDRVTICLGRTVAAVKTAGNAWTAVGDRYAPNDPRDLYALPWTGKFSVYQVPDDRYNDVKNDHIEITLTGAELNGTAYADWRSKGAKGCVLHFWGRRWTRSGKDVEGLVASYRARIKEPEMVGKVVAAIGVDWYGTENGKEKIDQAFSGYNHLLTTQERIVIGHNVGPKRYDALMDTAKVQAILGLR